VARILAAFDAVKQIVQNALPHWRIEFAPFGVLRPFRREDEKYTAFLRLFRRLCLTPRASPKYRKSAAHDFAGGMAEPLERGARAVAPRRSGAVLQDARRFGSRKRHGRQFAFFHRRRTL
jgi:hypothetical protein